MDLVYSIEFVAVQSTLRDCCHIVFALNILLFAYIIFLVNIVVPLTRYFWNVFFEFLIWKFNLSLLYEYIAQYWGKCFSISTSLFPHIWHNLSSHSSLGCSHLLVSHLKHYELICCDITCFPHHVMLSFK